jgi:hypothetical protein
VTKPTKSRAATTRKRKPAAKPKAKVRAAKPSPKEEAAFVETLIATGEAARLDDQGKLPAGATHKIVEDKAGHVKVVRRRFSMT